MTKLSLLNKQDKPFDRKAIQRALEKEHACYVLITCSNPSEKGEMQVELSYEGDEGLASYLLESAQSTFKKPEDFCEF